MNHKTIYVLFTSVHMSCIQFSNTVIFSRNICYNVNECKVGSMYCSQKILLYEILCMCICSGRNPSHTIRSYHSIPAMASWPWIWYMYSWPSFNCGLPSTSLQQKWGLLQACVINTEYGHLISSSPQTLTRQSGLAPKNLYLVCNTRPQVLIELGIPLVTCSAR